ncbi:MAG: hypothetical protein M1365_02625 [Actinobacteria bacterium]|nr:hypothetical protein [Actinomycetota bacterium]
MRMAASVFIVVVTATGTETCPAKAHAKSHTIHSKSKYNANYGQVWKNLDNSHKK